MHILRRRLVDKGILACCAALLTAPLAVQAQAPNAGGWVTQFPNDDIVPCMRELSVVGRGDRVMANAPRPEPIATAFLEIRTDDNKRRVANLELQHTQTLFSSYGSSFPSASQIEDAPSIPAGHYLMAWIINGSRRSNVTRLTVDPQKDLSKLPRVRMVQLEPEKAGNLPLIMAYISRARESDPAPDHIRVAMSELVLDGEVIPIGGIAYSGPNSPLPVGGTYRGTAVWQGAPDPTKPHTVAVRVGNQPFSLVIANVKDGGFQQSKAEPLETGTPLADAWDKATAAIAPPPQVKKVLTGNIADDRPIGRGGESRTFLMTLSSKDVTCQEWSLQNAFSFRNLPKGTYTLTCAPKGQEWPQVSREGVKVDEAGEPPALELSFAPAFEIAGRLTYPDGGIGALVQLTAKWVSDDGSTTYVDKVETDPSGLYTLKSPFARCVSYWYLDGDKEIRVEGVRVGTKMSAPAPVSNQ